MATAGGAASAHRGITNAQRVRNRQPDGGLIGFGGSPAIGGRSRRRSGSMLGADANSACVYGCFGASASASAVPDSTIWPRYITSTRSRTYSITFKSCEMKTYVSARSILSSRSKFSTCAVASGSWVGQRPSLGDYVMGTGTTRARPPPGGVRVAYAQELRLESRLRLRRPAHDGVARLMSDPVETPLVAGPGGSCSRPISSELQQECPPTQPPGARKPRQK
jgi:hypothetical protein